MKTEEAAQTLWRTSLIWKGRSEEEGTVGDLFKRLEPLYSHMSPFGHVARQASMLSDEIVKYKRKRARKSRKNNVVLLPIAVKKAVAA